MALLQFAGGMNHFVVVGDDTAFVALLADDEKVIGLRDHTWADKGAREDVSNFAAVDCEESFAVPEIDHDNCESNFCIVAAAHLFY